MYRIFQQNGAARGTQSRFFEEGSSGIIGQQFSAGSTGSTGNGVRSCGSDPAFHAQGSQDDVSSQANSLKLWSKICPENRTHFAPPPTTRLRHNPNRTLSPGRNSCCYGPSSHIAERLIKVLLLEHASAWPTQASIRKAKKICTHFCPTGAGCLSGGGLPGPEV